jgi:hypothetical protein
MGSESHARSEPVNLLSSSGDGPDVATGRSAAYASVTKKIIIDQK